MGRRSRHGARTIRIAMLGLLLGSLGSALAVVEHQEMPTLIAATTPVAPGFQSVAVGGGGFVTGISMSDDGATRVVRTDGFGGYRWVDGQWQLNVSADSLPADDVKPGLGGGVLAVAVAPSNSSIVYMAFNHNVYRSADGAVTWTRVLTGVSTAPNDDFRTWGSRLAIDPHDPDVVFYGSQLDGLLISRDGGAIWTTVNKGIVPPGLLIDIDNAQTRGSVDRPTDVLEQHPHWAGAGVSSIAFDRSGPTVDGHSQVVYAASYGNGVYRSTNGGGTWQKISPDSVAVVGAMRVLDNGDVVVTSRLDPTDLGGVSDLSRFRDGTWTTTGPSKQANWRAIAPDPTIPGRMALMGRGGSLALSVDYGLTWKLQRRSQESAFDVPWLSWALDTGSNFMSVGDIAFDPVVPGRLWFTEGTGVWFADVEASASTVLWHSETKGIEQLVSTGVAAAPGGKPMLTSWDRPIMRSEDLKTYPSTYGPTAAFGSAWSIDWSVTDPSYTVASVASHQWPSNPATSGYSTDNGRTWRPFPTIPGNSTNAVTTFGFGSMAVGDPGNVVWVPAYGKRPHYTKDGGQTWQEIVLPGVTDYALVDSKPYYVNRQVLAADKARAGTFYLFVLKNGTYRTTDGGATWVKMSDDSAIRNTDYNWSVTLKAVPGHEGELFMTPGLISGTTSQPFKHSTDGGQTWTSVRGLTGVTAFGFGRAFPGSEHPAIYASGYLYGVYGLYRSTDDAETWTFVTDYPAGRTPRVIAIDGDKDVVGRVYLAIGGSSLVYGDTASIDPGTPPTQPPVPEVSVPEVAVPSVPIPTVPVPVTPDADTDTDADAASRKAVWTDPRVAARVLKSTLRSTAGSAISRARVELQTSRDGTGPWVRVAKRMTNRRGVAAFRVKARSGAWFRLAFESPIADDAAYSRKAFVGPQG